MNLISKTLPIIIVLTVAVLPYSGFTEEKKADRIESSQNSGESEKMNSENYKKGYFAGGCFWCMQPPFDRLEGVAETWVGYSGGTEKNPTYKQVASGQTGHAEAIEVIFNPEEVSYEKLLETFWMNIDPTQENGQFADMGMQYRTSIFYVDEEQKNAAQESKKKLDQSNKFKEPIVTDIEAFKTFYRAEDYHQKYYEKNPIHYNLYKKGSGREGFINKNWKWHKSFN